MGKKHYEHIFQPVKIGNLTIKNRLETAPAGPFLADFNGDVTRELMEWYRKLAQGGAGIVTIGDSPVKSEMATYIGHVINLGTDKIVNTLCRLAEVIQRYGAKASIELTYHVDRAPAQMSREEIRSLRQDFADAAWRCLGAGMDMIMIHGAHGQAISQFFSPVRNLRTDEYGGSTANRVRFIKEMLSEIRDKVGDRLAIEYRLSGDELIEGGLTLEDQLEFASLIEDQVDLFNISAAQIFDFDTLPRMFPTAYYPHGVNAYLAAEFKKVLKTPVTAVGSINFDLAEEILANQQADMVAMLRSVIADPDCIRKARTGRSEEIRPCIRCNLCIDRLHWGYHWPARCAVNPVTGREAEFYNYPLPLAKKKVVVVGGGPAGVEAARTAAKRGHQVVLLEKEDHLGGALKTAANLPFKSDLREYLGWAVRTTCSTPNLDIRLLTEATPEIIKAEQPDILIVAVGSEPVIPAIPGCEQENVVLAGEVNLGTAKVGNRVVVAGAGLTGLETALHLAREGKKVTVIDLLSWEEIHGPYPAMNLIHLKTMFRDLGVEIKHNLKLEEITAGGAIVTDKHQVRTELSCDTVVLALGFRPRFKVMEKMQDLAPEVIFVGDCTKEKGTLQNAIMQGFNAAIDLGLNLSL